jgi:hypothetical protein
MNSKLFDLLTKISIYFFSKRLMSVIWHQILYVIVKYFFEKFWIRMKLKYFLNLCKKNFIFDDYSMIYEL